MMYPFLTLDDNSEIVHSEMRPDSTVKVYIEKPDEKDCFHHATCILPGYIWEDVFGFSQEEILRYQEIIESTAHLILQFSQEGGFDKETLSAIDDVNHGRNLSKTFHTVSELMEDLNA